MLPAVPLLLSTAFAVSSACAFEGFDSKPLPSPPLSAALAVGERKGAGPPPAGLTVRLAVRVVPPDEPVMVTTVELATGLVVTVNVVDVAPPATVTLAGTVATAELLLESVTTCPLDGAAALS